MKIYAGFLVIICVMMYGVMILTPATQGQKNQADDATVVQRGRVTDKERAYSREYKKLYTERVGNRLREFGNAAKANGPKDEINFALREGTIPTLQSEIDQSLSELLRSLSCETDAIVVGKPTSGTAHMLDDESFVYTEYDFFVETVLKNNAHVPFESGGNIAVTRPGGFVRLDGQLVRVGDERFTWLEKTQRYLIFLKYVPEAGGYAATVAKGDFALEGHSFRKLWRQAAPKELESIPDSKSLIALIQRAVSEGCLDSMKGGI